MNVSVKQLQVFVAIAKCQSFAEACALVHLSQPALSLSIKNLEHAVGGRLLFRSTRSVSLTSEGAEFYPVVQRLLADWEGAMEDVHNLFTLQRGKLDIAAMPTFAGSLLPDILAEFHRLYADINVTVHDVVAENVVELVHEGRVELGVTFDPGKDDYLKFHPLFLDKFVAVLPQRHPLLKKKTLKWSHLRNIPFITLQRPSSIRQLLIATLKSHNIEIKPAYETHQLTTIGRMVSTGLGVSVVPHISSKQMEEMGAVCRPLISPVVTRNIGLVTRKHYPLSVAAQAMIDVIFDWVGHYNK